MFNVRRLAFQEHLDRLGFADRFGDDHAQGPYLRLHAPVLIREHDLMTASDYPRLGHAKKQPVFKSRSTMTPGIPTAALRGGVGLETTVSSPLLWRT